MQGAIFSGLTSFLLGVRGVIRLMEHGKAIQTTIFDHMHLWYTGKVRGEEEHMGTGPIWDVPMVAMGWERPE